MNHPSALRSLLDRGTSPKAGVSLAGRLLVVGMACLTLALIGGLSQSLAPWSALSLCAGVGLAASLRWGRLMLAGAGAGLLLALLALGQSPVGVAWSVVVLCVACALAQRPWCGHALMSGWTEPGMWSHF